MNYVTHRHILKVMSTVVDIITREALKRGWNPHELSRRSGVSQATCHRIMQGKPGVRPTAPRDENIALFAKCFGMTEAEIRGISSQAELVKLPIEEEYSLAKFVDYNQQNNEGKRQKLMEFFTEFTNIKDREALSIIETIIDTDNEESLIDMYSRVIKYANRGLTKAKIHRSLKKNGNKHTETELSDE